MNRYRKRTVLVAILFPCIALVGWGRYLAPDSAASVRQAPQGSGGGVAAAPETQPTRAIPPPEEGRKNQLQEEIRKLRQDLELAVDLLEKSFGKPVRLESVRSVPVTLTAYSSTADQCDSSPYITASNTPVRHGVVAVSDDLMAEGLQFGQRILIPGHGLFEVRDRMNSRWRRRVDIWQSDRQAALLFGKQEGTMLWLADL